MGGHPLAVVAFAAVSSAVDSDVEYQSHACDDPQKGSGRLLWCNKRTGECSRVMQCVCGSPCVCFGGAALPREIYRHPTPRLPVISGVMCRKDSEPLQIPDFGPLGKLKWLGGSECLPLLQQQQLPWP